MASGWSTPAKPGQPELWAKRHCAYLEKEILSSPSQAAILSGTKLPGALEPDNWELASSLPFGSLERQGPWGVRNWPKLAYIDHVLATAAVGAKLSFAFEGRGLLLGFDFGRTSAEFKYQIDDADWKISQRDRPDWSPPDGWYRMFSVAEDLTPGKHDFRLEVIHGNPDPNAILVNQYAGTNFRLALIGILP